jgi:hypothetical protein
MVSDSNNLSVVDSNLLRERGREAKLKQKRFHIAAHNNREGARSEVSMYTIDEKNRVTQLCDETIQTDLTLPLWNKHVSQNLIDSSDRTRRKSTRFQQVDIGGKEMMLFNKALRDLETSGAISSSLIEILYQGFNGCLNTAVIQEQSKSIKL